MSFITKQISVDVAQENVFRSVVAKQHDTNSRFLKATITNEGKQISVNPSSVVTVNALREDGEAKSFAGTVNDDGTVTVPITSWMLELDGIVKCDISIIDSEERKLTTTTFTVSVESAANSGKDISEDENYDILVSLIARISENQITVDKELSLTSENPIGNKAVALAINNLFGEIQPHQFPTLPYAIKKDNENYALAKELATIKKLDDMKQIYVDSENGDDTNSGSAPDAPYKTLKKALTTYVFGAVPCCINIINDNAVFFENELYGETPVRKNLAIRAVNGEAKLISGIKSQWTAYSDNVFSAEISDSTILGCVDISNGYLAKDGLFEPMIKAASAEECQTTENSYCISGNNVYIHPSETSSADNIIPLMDVYKVRFNHATAPDSNFLYLENLNIIGTYFNTARSSVYPQAGKTLEYLAVNCIYQHNMKGDGVPHNGYDIVYEYNCKAGFSKADLFNTHHSDIPEEITDNCIMAFINCAGREAGYYSTTRTGNNNIFTSHDGENVLRLNCSGYNADGPLFADANGCRSVYIDCVSYNTAYPGVAAAGSWQFNNINARKNGFVTLKNCNIYDNRSNPRVYSECDIEVNHTDIFTNCNIVGSITPFAKL